MNESDGCALLRECFTAAGYAVEEDYLLEELAIRLDGFDPTERVGYEYVTTEAGDREEITAEVLAALEARMERGELLVLLVDELDVTGEEDLRLAAERFLSAVKARASSGAPP